MRWFVKIVYCRERGRVRNSSSLEFFFFFSSRRRHTRYWRDWSSDVCSSDLLGHLTLAARPETLAPLEEADLVVVAGCRLGEVTTQTYALPRGDQAVIQVDAEIGRAARRERVEISGVAVSFKKIKKK